MTGSLPAASGRNFIGYRREDTAYPAGWLYDGLAEQSAAARSSRTLTPSSWAFNDQSRLSAVDLAQIASPDHRCLPSLPSYPTEPLQARPALIDPINRAWRRSPRSLSPPEPARSSVVDTWGRAPPTEIAASPELFLQHCDQLAEAARL
jgi:hypothetical protein